MITVEVGTRQVVKRAHAPVARQAWRMLRREYWLLAMLRPERAPRAIDLCLAADGTATLTLERLPGTSLDAVLAAGDATGALHALVDVAVALHALHVSGFVHGDVAPRNVLVQGQGATARGWLIDFGFAAPIGSRSRLVRGTPATMAPELMAGGSVSAATDLFAFGRLLTGIVDGGWDLPAWAGEVGSDTAAERSETANSNFTGARRSAVLALGAKLTSGGRPAAGPHNALSVAAELRAALRLASAPESTAVAPLALWIRRRAAWKLLRAIAGLARGNLRAGGSVVITGGAGSGRRTLQQVAERVARCFGVAVRRDGRDRAPGDVEMAPGEAARPVLILLAEREPDALQQHLVRWREVPNTLGMGISDQPPGDPATTWIQLAPLTRIESARLGAFMLRTRQLPAALVSLSEPGPRQPIDWRRRLDRCAIRRGNDGNVQGLVPLPAPASEPQTVREAVYLGFWGEIAPPPPEREGSSRLAAVLAESLQTRSPGEIVRWGAAHGLQRTEIRAIGLRVADSLLAPVSSAPGEALDAGGRRALWILRELGGLEKRISLGLELARGDLAAGRPRAAALMARSLVRHSRATEENHWQALVIAVQAARRLGHWRAVVRGVSRALPQAPARYAHLLRLERIEALTQGGDLERAWQEAAALRIEDVDASAALILARLAQLRGDHARARQWAGTAFACSRSRNRLQAARALNVLAISDLAVGRLRPARRRLENALRVRRRLRDLSGMAACELHLAEVDEAEGRRADAQRRLQHCLDLRLTVGQAAGAADALERIGRLAARSGDTKGARDQFTRALRMRLRLGDLSGTAALRHNLGILALRDGDAQGARRAARDAASTFLKLGDRANSLAARAQAALALEVLGRRGQAISEMLRVMHLRRSTGGARELAATLKHLADLFGRGGRNLRAARLAALGAAVSREDPVRRARLVLLQADHLLAAGRFVAARAAIASISTWPSTLAIGLQRDLLWARLQVTTPELPSLANRARACGENEIALAAALYLATRGEPDLARTALQGAAPSPSGTPSQVAYDLARAEVEISAGAWEQAEVRAAAARHSAERLAMPVVTAHALLLQATLLLRAERHAAARVHLDQAHELLRGSCAGVSTAADPDLLRRIERTRALCSGASSPRQHLALTRVAELLGSIEDPEKLFPAILRVVLDTVAAERGVLTLRQGESDDFEIAVARNVDSAALGDVQRISRTILSRAYREGAVLHSSNALQDEDFSGLRSVQLYRIVSFACAPLVVGGRIVGTIYLDRGTREGAFSHSDLAFLAALAKISALALEHARLHNRLRMQAGALRQEVETLYGLGSLVQKSRPMARLVARARRLADAAVTVLIEGETGVGKSVLARALHYSGRRSGRPFVELDCGAIPLNLVESELFGHVKGAFTGADRERDGVFQAADGGTLFLDEIGNLPLEGQAKLLRVLQDGRVRRVGAEQSMRVDVRLLCASNSTLEEEVAAGRFREDLYFRINPVVLRIPPLRERRADIIPLAERFLQETAVRMGLKPPLLTAELRRILRRARWPGNVRQLQNEIHRLLILHPTEVWTEDHLSADLGFGGVVSKSVSYSGRTVAAVEKEMLVDALKRAHWNRRRAAERLGMTHRQVCYRIAKYGLTPPSRKRGEQQ